MFTFGLYLIVLLVALSWVALDENPLAAFEIVKRRLHATARDMGIYWKWLVPSLLRAVLLLSCVTTGVVAATWMMWQNPWGLGWPGRATLFAIMLFGSIIVLAMPHLSAHLRFRHFLYRKAAELTVFALSLSSDDVVQQQLEPAKKDAFAGERGWSAWHPRQEVWMDKPYWTGLVPVVFLHRDVHTSLIFLIDLHHFLAWKLPQGSIAPGEMMPIYPLCCVQEVCDLRGCEGWSVVRADLVWDDCTT